VGTGGCGWDRGRGRCRGWGRGRGCGRGQLDSSGTLSRTDPCPIPLDSRFPTPTQTVTDIPMPVFSLAPKLPQFEGGWCGLTRSRQPFRVTRVLKETLTIDLVTTDLEGSDKPSVIRGLLDILCRSGKIKDRDLALRDLLDHEAGISTGMEHGVAIPHAKSDAVDALAACVGISRRKIDFENLDRKPSRIFVLTLSPKGDAGPHIRFLAEISRLLTDARMRKAMLKARNDAQLLELLTQ